MNIEIPRKKLGDALGQVGSVISTKTSLPILSNVLLVAEGAKLKVTGTDLDVTCTIGVDCRVMQPGKITLPANKLKNIISNLEGENVELEVNDKLVCKIQCGSSKFHINGLSDEEFPPAPMMKEELFKFTITQGTLRQALKLVSYAMSTDESRYVLNAVLFEIKEAQLNLVATDGRRLAMTNVEVDCDAAVKGTAVIPSKTVKELLPLLRDAGVVDVRCSLNMAQFLFRDDNGVTGAMVTKLIEGNYPNYVQVIPGEAKECVKFAREEVLSAVRRAAIMTSEKSNSVKAAFTKNLLTITANSPDIGEAREQIACNFKGKDMSIAFNPNYLLDTLAACPDDEFTLKLIDELSPGRIEAVTCNSLVIIMPMRLS